MGGKATAQENLSYERLLLLIAGPSGDRIDPQEQFIVNFLNELRAEHELYNLQMGTMHFDRPREASMLSNSLDIRPNDGIVVALVELSPRGMPTRSLLKESRVTSSSVRQIHRKVITQWADLSGESIPEALRHRVASVPPPSNPPVFEEQVEPPSTSPPPHEAPSNDNGPRPSDVVYSFEGIRAVVMDLSQRTDAMWLGLKDEPIRNDHMDIPVREATLGLAEAINNLRAAHQRGVIYPLQEMEAVRFSGVRWKLTEPEFYLPVELRSDVETILKLLRQVEEIEYQGKNGA